MGIGLTKEAKVNAVDIGSAIIGSLVLGVPTYVTAGADPELRKNKLKRWILTALSGVAGGAIGVGVGRIGKGVMNASDSVTNAADSASELISDARGIASDARKGLAGGQDLVNDMFGRVKQIFENAEKSSDNIKALTQKADAVAEGIGKNNPVASIAKQFRGSANGLIADRLKQIVSGKLTPGVKLGLNVGGVPINLKSGINLPNAITVDGKLDQNFYALLNAKFPNWRAALNVGGIKGNNNIWNSAAASGLPRRIKALGITIPGVNIPDVNVSGHTPVTPQAAKLGMLAFSGKTPSTISIKLNNRIVTIPNPGLSGIGYKSLLSPSVNINPRADVNVVGPVINPGVGVSLTADRLLDAGTTALKSVGTAAEHGSKVLRRVEAIKPTGSVNVNASGSL